MNQYFKNFILCGDVDHHCLLCKESFRTIADVEKHIRWEKHRRSMKTQTCVPKFKQNKIFKIGDFFYCEICNFVIRDASAVCAHINDEKHKTNRKIPAAPRNTIGRYDLGFVIINKMFISLQLWHGIFDKHCILCDTDIENGKEHMGSQDHIINLIQTKVKSVEKNYYREMKEDKFQCFACKKIFPIKNVLDHWTSDEHTGNLCGSDSNVDSKPEVVDHKKMLEDKLIESQRMFYKIDADKEEAVCKECKLSINVNFKDMIVHTKGHSDIKLTSKDIKKSEQASSADSSEEVVYRDVADHGKRRSELSKYGKQHSIRLNAGGSKGYCMVCDVYLSADKELFKQHIKGTVHQGLKDLKSGKNQKINKVVKFKSLLDCILIYLSDIKEFLVNRYICIDWHSMVFLRPINDEPHYKKTKCYCCDIYIDNSKEEEHCKSVEHKAKFLAAKVVIMETEFVREIQPNIYHCGFCNRLFPYWKNLEKHHKSWNHTCERVENNDKRNSAVDFPETVPRFKIIPRYDCDVLYSQLIQVIFE